jgi:hypothetical protein
MRHFFRTLSRSAGALAAAALLLTAASAIGQGTNATLSGHVLDPHGSGLPGVSVNAASQSTGFSRGDTTAADGSYTINSVPPGTYTVTYQVSGFKTIEQKNVELNVATTRSLDVTMQVSAVAEMITVTTEAPLIRTDASIGAIISQQELETLPLNGRQFANVAVLAPGTQLAYNTDPTKPGQLTVQLDGGSGRNVNYIMDGGDNTDDTIGGALQNFSLESVQEFKIQTQQYKAEYGRSTGGVLNVVTKSGSNEFHGSAFEYFRDKNLNSETESEKLAGTGKEDYRRNQYGASLGGPIMKDKAFFFLTGERTEQKTNIILDTGGVYPALDGTPAETPFRDDLLAGKITADVSASQFLQVRYGYQKNSELYGVYANHTPDSFGTILNKYSSILAGLQSQLGQRALNEFVFQYTKFDNAITPNSDNPTIYFASGVLSGQNPNTPQTTRQTKYQFKDDITYSADWHGSHDLKFGVNFVHEPTLAGDFSIGTAAPTYVLNGDSLDSSVASISQNGGFSGYSSPKNIYDAFIQDDWRPSSRLTVNVGLRYDLNLGYDLNQASNQMCQELSTQTQFNDAPYYKDFRGWDCKLKNDHKNWAPRFGFAYDLTGQGKTIVHGGWGIYYDFPYLNATLLFPAIALTNYGQIYSAHPPADFRIGDPLPPNELPGTVGPAPTEVADPTVTKTPYSRQLSVGISHQVADWLGVSLEYSHINYRDLPYRFKFNIAQADGTPRFSDFGDTVRMWNGGGYADYDGMNLGFNARVSEKLRFQGFYTLSHATGNILLGADEFRLTHSDAQPDLGGSGYGGRKDVSVNPLDPNCHDICQGNLFTDARHKVTFGATYAAPWGVNVSGVFRYRSATPFLEYDGRDLNGDGYNVDLDPGHHLLDARGHSFEQTDIAVSKDFMIGGGVGIEVIAQVFNIFNASNPAYYNGRRMIFDDNGNAIPNPAFGKPQAFAGDTHQGEQRLLQLAARVHF